MALHPAAWIAWLTSVGVLAFAVTNPLYIVLGIMAVLVVHLAHPPDPSPTGRAVRTFLILGLVFLALRIVFVAFLPNPGRTVLFVVPELKTPSWLGSMDLGGDITAEVLAGGATEGLRLLLVLVAFGVFNARADIVGLIRTVPSAFRDAGLVVSIAIAFVPGMLRTVNDVRDAQRLRGESGLKRLAPSLVVPIVGLSLERALLLAESMDVRGYGRGSATRASRTFISAGLFTILLAVAVWIAGGRGPGAVIAVAGCAAIVWGFRSASISSPVTRLSGKPVGALDVAVIAAAAVTVVALALAGTDAAFDPYPVIDWPAFDPKTAVATLFLTVPSLTPPR